MDHLACPEKLDPASTADLALHDAAAGDDAGARDLDRGDDLDAAFTDLAVGGLAQTLGRALHVFGELVDHVVVADFDLRPFRGGGARRRRLEVEAHDDGARNAGQQQVRVADRTHSLAHDLDRDYRIFDLLQCREQRLERALRIRLDDQAELFDLAFLGAAGEVLEGDARSDVARRLDRALLDELGQGNLARRLLRTDDLEDVAGLRYLAHAGHDHRRRRRRFVHTLPAVIGQRAHAAVDVAANEVVADFERARLHEHRRDRAATALEVGVDDRPDRVAVGVRLQLEDIGRKHDRRQQVVDAQAGPRAEVNALVLTAVVPCDDALLGQLLMDAVDVGVFLVDLVDGDDDRHVRGARVVDRLDRLRHHAVVGGHDQDNEVGDLGAPGAHGGERLVARRVDEHDWMPIGGFDLVGADPLGDASGLACRDACLADGVEDRGLAVVDVAQHGHDGRARLELGRVFVGEREELLARGRHDVALALAGLDRHHVLAGDRLHGEAELIGHDLGGREVDYLVDRGQDLGGHELLDHLDRAHAELLGQVLDRKRGRQYCPPVAVGLDLDRHRGRFEGRARSLDRARRQGRRGVTGQSALLQEVDQLLLADPKFPREFVCLHLELMIMPPRVNSKPEALGPNPSAETTPQAELWPAGRGPESLVCGRFRCRRGRDGGTRRGPAGAPFRPRRHRRRGALQGGPAAAWRPLPGRRRRSALGLHGPAIAGEPLRRLRRHLPMNGEDSLSLGLMSIR